MSADNLVRNDGGYGWGRWWDADARIDELTLEHAIRERQHDMLDPPGCAVVIDRDGDRDRRDGPGTLDGTDPIVWASQPDPLLVRDLWEVTQDEGVVPGIGRIRERYGIGAGRAGRIQNGVRETERAEGPV